MICRGIFTLFLLIYSYTNVIGQHKLYLEHKTKTSKKKYLNLDKTYEIKTIDTIYYSKIIGFTDTNISIFTRVKTNKDTTYIHTYKINKTKDTTVFDVVPIYQDDTILVATADIQVIKKEWFENRKWVEPFGWLLVGAALGAALLPFAAIAGSEELHDLALLEVVLIGVSVPPIIISYRKTKYDLRKKWTLKSE